MQVKSSEAIHPVKKNVGSAVCRHQFNNEIRIISKSSRELTQLAKLRRKALRYIFNNDTRFHHKQNLRRNLSFYLLLFFI